MAVAVPELRRLAEFAGARGLRLAIYPHVKDWTERTADASWRPHLGLWPDAGAECVCVRDL